MRLLCYSLRNIFQGHFLPSTTKGDGLVIVTQLILSNRDFNIMKVNAHIICNTQEVHILGHLPSVLSSQGTWKVSKQALIMFLITFAGIEHLLADAHLHHHRECFPLEQASALVFHR